MSTKQEGTKRENSIELLLGPMRSNKTEELLRRVAMRREYAKQDVLIFKPDDDHKSQSGSIESRNKKGWGRMEAIEIPSGKPEVMWDLIAARERETGHKVQCVAIDEGQFVARLFPMAGSLLEAGYDVIAAGLDLDFRGLPFGDMLKLMWYVPVYGGNTTWCISYCKCGERAFFSQRLINGEPAPYDSPVTLAGDEMYEPRCREHFILPGRPESLPW